MANGAPLLPNFVVGHSEIGPAHSGIVDESRRQVGPRPQEAGLHPTCWSQSPLWNEVHKRHFNAVIASGNPVDDLSVFCRLLCALDR